MKKICFKCNVEKEISFFYKHKAMHDGHLNKCKECTKKDVKCNYRIKTEDESFVQKERERGKNKYHRLNYREKHKDWLKSNQWHNNPKYKSLRKKIKCGKGIELHHWNYNEEYIEDVFILDIKKHRRLHGFMKLDKDLLMFVTNEGVLLDSKEKHESFINECEILKKI